MKGNCGECERRYFCEIDPDKCDEWPDPVPKTNADRIRSMPIEKIADYLMQYNDDWGDYYTPNYEFYDTYEEAKEATIKWLQQPAEGE